MEHIYEKETWVHTIKYKRTWKSLYLLRRPILERVFVGYINVIKKDFNGTILEIVDNKHRLNQMEHIERKREELDGIPYLRPWLYELDKV